MVPDPCQQPSIDRQRIQRAEEAQAVYEITNEGIDWDHAFGFQLAERDMNGPLIRTGRAQAVIRQVGALAGLHVSPAAATPCAASCVHRSSSKQESSVLFNRTCRFIYLNLKFIVGCRGQIVPDQHGPGFREIRDF